MQAFNTSDFGYGVWGDGWTDVYGTFEVGGGSGVKAKNTSLFGGYGVLAMSETGFGVFG